MYKKQHTFYVPLQTLQKYIDVFGDTNKEIKFNIYNLKTLNQYNFEKRIKKLQMKP